ncbi:Lactate utilization protein C [Baekduia alba]|nr:Lactate utilization protein C [Baekduia alba]
MSAARAEVLRRIRDALGDERAPAPPPAPAAAAAAPRVADPVARFTQRVGDYRAGVTVVEDASEVGAAVAAALTRHAAADAVVPADLPAGWVPTGIAALADDPPLPHARLAQVGAVVTACALAIAETGTLILDGGVGQGRRAITLLPDVHVCVVGADQIVGTVPEAIARLAGTPRPLTLVSGPSATSDIGFVRVEGVHGPRRLEVVVSRRA